MVEKDIPNLLLIMFLVSFSTLVLSTLVVLAINPLDIRSEFKNYVDNNIKQREPPTEQEIIWYNRIQVVIMCMGGIIATGINAYIDPPKEEIYMNS